MDFKFGFSIESYATIQKFKLIGAMKLFCDQLKIVVFCNKLLVDQVLVYVFYGRFQSLDPLQIIHLLITDALESWHFAD